MEKEGLVRNTEFIEKNGLEIGTLITDRHPQITKWMREKQPNINHYYDIWHVAKCRYTHTIIRHYKLITIIVYYVTFQKKIDTLAKAKDCHVVGDWKKSMTNHLYWSAVSTPCGEEEMILAKWLSLANHVQDIHSGHCDLFPGRSKHWTLDWTMDWNMDWTTKNIILLQAS